MRSTPLLFGYTVYPKNRQTVPPDASLASIADKPETFAAENAKSARISGHLKPFSANGRKLRSYRQLTVQINKRQVSKPGLQTGELEFVDVKQLSDTELMAKTDEFKRHIAKRLGVSVAALPQYTDQKKIQAALDEILPEAFTVAREACRRALAQNPYDVQVMGGNALHEGSIAEMKTGEGKTLTIVMPAYLNALMGKGVHIQTANDYLAQRDASEMGPAFEALGLSVGLVQPDQPLAGKRQAYRADITYSTTSEMIFDYLRDQQVHALSDKVNPKGYFFVIADEADKLMLDEALTPHIISQSVELSQTEVEEQVQAFYNAAVLVEKLEAGKHYTVDKKWRTVQLTDAGDELLESLEPDLSKQFWLSNALKAKALYHRDKDYVLKDGEIQIVDPQTGRILHGRKWNDGLQQAIEVKELLYAEKKGKTGLENAIHWTSENVAAATMGYRSFFMMYAKRAGLTGTGKTDETEFRHLYNMPVWQIPTHKPFILTELPDLLCKDRESKLDLVAAEIQRIRETGHGLEGAGHLAVGKGRPVLVGTGSIEDSEVLSERLTALGIPHNVLNAKNHAKEADIIAHAGRKGAVTIATNMAGRGTDIKLGGDPKAMTEEQLRKEGIEPDDSMYQQRYAQVFAEMKNIAEAEAKIIKDLGGLYVIGTERARSRRIDNQLRGRSGRQGDPGEFRVITAITDETIKPWLNSAVAKTFSKMFADTPYITPGPRLQKQLRACQKKIEMQDAETRKKALELDMELNLYRKSFYENRDAFLNIDTEDDFRDTLTRMTARFLEDAVEIFDGNVGKLDALTHASMGVTDDNRDEKLAAFKKALYPHSMHNTALSDSLVEAYFELNCETRLSEQLENSEDLESLLSKLTRQLTAKATKNWEDGKLPFYRNKCLTAIDGLWQNFLSGIEEMADSKTLYVYSQQNPDVFYIREVGRLFRQMNNLIGYQTLAACAAN